MMHASSITETVMTSCLFDPFRSETLLAAFNAASVRSLHPDFERNPQVLLYADEVTSNSRLIIACDGEVRQLRPIRYRL